MIAVSSTMDAPDSPSKDRVAPLPHGAEWFVAGISDDGGKAAVEGSRFGRAHAEPADVGTNGCFQFDHAPIVASGTASFVVPDLACFGRAKALVCAVLARCEGDVAAVFIEAMSCGDHGIGGDK